MTRAVVLLALLLTGCGAHAAPPAASQVAANGVASKSLAGDLLGMVGPFAAKKALQAAIGAALKKDAKTMEGWPDLAHQPVGAQTDFLKKRIGLLQKAIAGAELALLPMKNVDGAHEALDALKAEDGHRAQVADKSPANLLAWGDALVKGLEALKATF